MTPIKRALISVADKTGIIDFSRRLQALGIELLSTGGTARLLAENGIAVSDVAAYTGFPEIMDGRIKTLHPKIHAALLGRGVQDAALMRQHGIVPIGLLVVNLYPFEQAVARAECTLAEAIQHIDIGGPAMLRAAAKNHRHVGVLVDQADYAAVLAELEGNANRLSAALRFCLAKKAFAHTAHYDANISNYLGARTLAGDDDAAVDIDDYPDTFTSQFYKVQTLRYGENPHQTAALYSEPAPAAGTLAGAVQLQGKPLSYNNLADADAALACVSGFAAPACVIVKHANPCGVAIAQTIMQAYEQAHGVDPTSAFGGIIAFNRPLDEATVKRIFEQQFVELILAPSISVQAQRAAAAKHAVRLLTVGSGTAAGHAPGQLQLKRISGGLLVQDEDGGRVDRGDLKIVSKRTPSAAEWDDLLFAWCVVKYVKSNAIVYAKGQRTLGIGAGQMSRVHSARIAAEKAADAGLDLAAAVMASDAFFPFADGVEAAAAAGIAAVIQPGGSVNDAVVIAAADEHGMAMAFTGMRHFRH